MHFLKVEVSEHSHLTQIISAFDRLCLRLVLETVCSESIIKIKEML